MEKGCMELRERLSGSKFRSRFRLGKKRQTIHEKGPTVIA